MIKTTFDSSKTDLTTVIREQKSRYEKLLLAPITFFTICFSIF